MISELIGDGADISQDDVDQRIATVLERSRQQWLTYGSGHVHGLMLDGEEPMGFERHELHREPHASKAIA